MMGYADAAMPSLRRKYLKDYGARSNHEKETAEAI